jgi:4-amino-4-deoxy-L-arabinose transferase-like glycosyltransferase
MESVMKLTQARGFWAALAVIVIVVYLVGLGIPLLGPDEPRYSQVAREMFGRGDWITPTLGGHNWFEKPALLYWLQIASYHLFGVNEFAARFGSALFGLGTVASIWIVAKFGIDKKGEGGKSSANWIALIAASTIGLIVFARGASFDIILTFPITASLAGFLAFELGDTETPRLRFAGLVAFYFFAGAAVLAKGLVGIVFPIAIVGLYFLFSWRKPDRQFLLSLIWGPIILLLVAATWNIPMYLEHGWSFVDEFYIQHHFQRYTSNKYQHPQPFYFFFWVLPLMTIPWLPFFFAAIWRLLKRLWARPFDRRPNNGSDLLTRFAIVWILVPLAFFSFSGSKLPGYILPALPGAIILTGTFIMNHFAKSPIHKFWVLAIACSTFIVIIVLLLFVVPRYAEVDSVKGLVAAANARGYTTNKVTGFKTTSHNAEFYAAGRLLRSPDGRQIRFETPLALAAEIRAEGQPLLVLVQIEHVNAIADSSELALEVISDNEDLAIAAVSTR